MEKDCALDVRKIHCQGQRYVVHSGMFTNIHQQLSFYSKFDIKVVWSTVQ